MSEASPQQPDAVEKAILARLTGAKKYEPELKARVITDPAERLQPERAPGIVAVIRISRGGRSADLAFSRRTRELKSVAVSAADGKLARVYDGFTIASPDRALEVVEQLLGK